MEAIRKYVERFFAKKKLNRNYDINVGEMFSLANEAIKNDAIKAINTTFDYGYAKGYRAAMAEMKKGGAA